MRNDFDVEGVLNASLDNFACMGWENNHEG